ncbi:imidazole glycerol phosphate synthase subunit HisH [Ferrovibrio terrae]|uniref:imidazole glycerol phosphate synthase subunit HisH n=1 Tax=Ferrovibrio terrae TaxID=2594003 RepID=UPI0031380654
MTKTVAVIDYGVGNLLSVTRALSHVGCEPALCSDARGLERADRVILPGVGAFADGMAGLDRHGLTEAIRRFADTGRPLLGICLGMQMLLDTSTEFGSNEGLGLIPGSVIAIPNTGADNVPHKIPHIGWNRLLPAAANIENPLLKDLPESASVYFVHSFMADPATPAHRVADCDYDGRRISAVIGRDNIHGCQFHPEKSGPVGLQILRNFVNL